MGDGVQERDANQAAMMPVHSVRVGSATVVSVAGEVDMLTAPGVLSAVRRCLADGTCGLLVVDLAGVTFLGSAGLAALLQIKDAAAGGDVRFHLVAGTNRRVVRPLELSGLVSLFSIFSAVEDALSDRTGEMDRHHL